jgi:hypothetical protein
MEDGKSLKGWMLEEGSTGSLKYLNSLLLAKWEKR